MNEIRTINYNGITFQIKGMEIYYNGKLVKPSFNRAMNRYYVSVYLGKGE